MLVPAVATLLLPPKLLGSGAIPVYHPSELCGCSRAFQWTVPVSTWAHGPHQQGNSAPGSVNGDSRSHTEDPFRSV